MVELFKFVGLNLDVLLDFYKFYGIWFYGFIYFYEKLMIIKIYNFLRRNNLIWKKKFLKLLRLSGIVRLRLDWKREK